MYSLSLLLFAVFYIISVFVKISIAGLTADELLYFQDNGVNISSVTRKGVEYWLMEHSGIPDHPTEDVNPHEPSDQEHDYFIPKVPVDKTCEEGYGCLPMGVIGVTVNGVPMFNPYTNLGYNAVEGEHREIFDSCDGHPTVQGTYHYHMVPGCVYQGTNMELIGVALDGNPIYGTKDENGDDITTLDLDVCHGRMYNGRYIYHLTNDFPYILGCYHSNRKSGNGTGSGDGPDRGLPCYSLCHNPRIDSIEDCNTIPDDILDNSLCPETRQRSSDDADQNDKASKDHHDNKANIDHNDKVVLKSRLLEVLLP